MILDDIQIEQKNHLVVITFKEGNLGEELIQEVVHELSELMRYSNALYFVFDMSEVVYICSGCLGVLVEFLEDLTPVRGRIGLANCQRNVEFLFKVTRLDKVFSLHEELDEACAELCP